MSILLPTVKPRPYQVEFQKAFDQGAQYSVLSWPRRAGKDVSSFSALVSRAMQKPGNYYYLFPTRAWAQRALWDNICSWAGGKRMVDLICPEYIVDRKNNSDFFLDLVNGSRIKIDGTDNLNFVGQGGAGYVLSEFSLHKPEVTGFLAPILTEGDAWVLFNGTLRGKANHLWELYDKNKDREGWFTQWYTLEDTKTNYWISPDGSICVNPELEGQINPLDGRPYKNIQDDVDAGLISYSMARQEYLNEATLQVEGSYYGHEMEVARGEERIGSITAPNSLVYTFWDLGGASQQSDETVIIFAVRSEDRWYIIDHYANTGHKIDHYVQVLNARGYEYAGHYAPHDAKKQFLFGDLISKADELGLKLRRVPKSDNVLSDIEICRRKWANIWMHEPTTMDLVQHLEAYHERNGRPHHDQSSHFADAFRTMCMADHLGLVHDYLSGSRVKFELPDRVSDTAEEYVDGDGWTNTTSGGSQPLWGQFR